jgi:hypothetical protein
MAKFRFWKQSKAVTESDQMTTEVVVERATVLVDELEKALAELRAAIRKNHLEQETSSES